MKDHSYLVSQIHVNHIHWPHCPFDSRANHALDFYKTDTLFALENIELPDSRASTSLAAEQAGVWARGASFLNNSHSGASAGGGSVGSSVKGSKLCWAGGHRVPWPCLSSLKGCVLLWNVDIMPCITLGMAVKMVDGVFGSRIKFRASVCNKKITWWCQVTLHLLERAGWNHAQWVWVEATGQKPRGGPMCWVRLAVVAANGSHNGEWQVQFGQL